MGTALKSLAVVRNFTEKLARISDAALFDLQAHCPNLQHLEVVFTRKFDAKIGQYLGSGSLRNLVYLDLSHCTIPSSLEALAAGCPRLTEFKLAGDAWIRDLVFKSIAKHPAIKVFHMGHYEHSDCDCKSIVPKDPVFA